MSCLVHDKHFSCLFHAVINELRNERSISITILRTMPRKCCTCNAEDKETIEPVVIKEKDQLIKLKNLIERVNREKQNRPKLILSLNRLENIIEKNRAPAPVIFEPSSVQSQIKSRRIVSSDESTSSSDSEDIVPMEISKPTIRNRKKQNQQIKKPLKPIKSGTFVFLPYNSEGKSKRKKSDSLIDVAKTLQRGRFLGRNGHIAKLEKQYGVRINLITPKTTQPITDALENAKKGLENLTIRNQKETMRTSEKQEGEWVLIRSKKPQNQKPSVDIEQVLNELTDRWETCLKIKKRKCDESEDSDDSIQKKK